MSIILHVRNIHEAPLAACEHEPMTGPHLDREGKPLEWFNEDEIAYDVLREIILDSTWLMSLKYYVRFR